RGAGGTTTTSHSPGTATLYTSKSVQCAIAASFSQDEDQSMEDALKTIIRLAGGEVTCRASVDGVHNFSGASTAGITMPTKNFIAEFDLPAINDGSGVGLVFRATSGVGFASGRPYGTGGSGYYLEVERSGTTYYLSLYKALNPNVLIERITIRPTNM